MTETKNKKPFYNTKIPSDWEIVKVSDYGRVYTGNTPLTNDLKNYNGDYLFVSPGDLGEYKYIVKTEKTLSLKGFSTSRKFPKGSVLFTCIGSTIGKSGIAKTDLTANQQINAIVVNDCNSNEFLYYQLERNANKIKLIAGEQAVPIINKSQFESIKIIRAPLHEQKAIARVLSTWDEAIYKTKQLIIQKELRKKWLMQNLLTGKMRLKGFDGEWKKCSAFDFLKQRNEQATNNGNIPLFSLTIENGITEKSDRYEREFLVKDKSIKNYKIVYPNDIVFNPANLRWGAIAKHSRNFKVLLSPIYEVLTVKQGYNIDFISYLVSSPRQISYYASILEGTLIERMAVKVEPFLSTKYEIPPFKEQTAIAEILQASDKEIILLNAKVEKLKEQKKGLMQQLLTGKKRLILNEKLENYAERNN